MVPRRAPVSSFPSHMQNLSLITDALHLEVAPAWGGRITRLTARRERLPLLLPIDASSFSPVNWPKGGAYPLLPYSNRIRSAQLTFAGSVYSLPPHPLAMPHTLHGVGHTLAWEVTEHTKTRLVLAADYSGKHWPWRFHAEQRIQLEDATLLVGLSVTNLGEQAMPVGAGYHPYLPVDDQTIITFGSEQRWLTDAAGLPNGVVEDIASSPLVVYPHQAAQQDYIGYFSGWSRILELRTACGCITVRGGAGLDHLIVFMPKSAPYLCIEPVSHVADAFNLSAQGMTNTGMAILAPNARFSRDIAIDWTPHG